jgi:MFS family permease
VLAALPLAAKLSQLFTSAYIERAGHWPRTALICGAIARVLLLGAAAVPVVFGHGPAAARALVGFVALSSLAASFFDLALLTWMAELVPPSVRGRFLGRRNRNSGVVAQIAALVAAVILDRISGGGGSPTLFAALFAVAGIIGLGAIPVLARVPTPRRTTSRVELPPLRKMLITPLRDTNFRIFLGFATVWHVALGMSAPFLIVFMLEGLGLSLSQVTLLASLTSMVGALTMEYWGRLGDHFGTKTVLRVGTYLITLPTLFWFFVTPDLVWLLVPIHLVSGFGWGAYNTNVNNMVLKLAPEGRGPSYVATLSAVAGSAEAVGPLIGGIIISQVGGWAPSTLWPYYVVVLIAFALRAIATVIPGHVHEAGGVAVGRMVRTMARLRSMSVEETFSPIFTHVYTHVARIADFIAREPALARRTRA